MEYIILDLEWNNGYCKQFSKPINEIIEIGALRLDDKLNICDSFKQLVTPVLTKKLSSRVKQLTHISNEDVQTSGIPFLEAAQRFTEWLGDADKIFMTWSDTDLYILSEAYQFYQHTPIVPFICRYMDAQKYCQSFLPDSSGQNQISLLNAAIKLDIDRDEETLHRALADCVLTAKCFIKCFDSTKISSFVHQCDSRFFEKLLFKPYYVKDPSMVGIHLEHDQIICPECKNKMHRIGAIESVNNAFRTVYICKSCHIRYFVTYRVKQQFDRVDMKRRVVPAKRKQSDKVQKKVD